MILPAAKNSTIFFLDWDNTLFGTDYLSKYQNASNYIQINDKIQGELDKCEDEIIILIDKLLNHGEIYIVTNATNEWIQTCMDICYPRLWELHKDFLSNRLISARDLYQHKCPNPLQWKYETFAQLLQSIKPTQQFDSVFSIGDSNIERDALFRVMKTKYPGSYAKSIKFLCSSSIEQIIKQLKLINLNIMALLERKSDIDLVMKESKIDFRNKYRRV